MNRHRQIRRMFAVTACAGVTVAGGLFGSSAAMASGSLTCDNVYANGSSLQGVAQQKVWTVGFPSYTECSSSPTVTYTKTSSGAGLEEFGNGGNGFVTKEDTSAPSGVLDGYVGTDDAPNSNSLGNAETAAVEATLVELTIPVAQAPVAVLLSLPAACTVAENGRVNIQNQYLDDAFSARIPAGGTDAHNGGAAYPANTWGAFFALIGQSGVTDSGAGSGTGCETPISIQVRSTASGTSFAFKSYLSQVDSAEWAQYASDYDYWPVATDNEGNASGGNLATDTAARPGSIGYANTADAAGITGTPFGGKAVATTAGGTSHQILWAQVQNNGTSLSSPGYGSPKAASGNIGNCATTKITPGEAGAPYSVTDSWSGILASDPDATHDLGGNYYSICALTYDLAWKHYEAPGLSTGYSQGTNTPAAIEATVKNYLTYVTSSAEGQGQAAINSNYYTSLPTPLLPKAQDAAAYIGL